MLDVYNAKNPEGERRCGYFDETITNGGPQQFDVVSFFNLHDSISPGSVSFTGLFNTCAFLAQLCQGKNLYM